MSGRRAATALLVVLLAAFMDLLDVTIVTVAAPAIADDLGASDAQLQWTLAAYTLALGSGLVTGGRLGDALGRRQVFLAALAAFAVASAACALAPDAGALIALRVCQGLAGGVMVPQVLAIIRSSFAPADMAKAFGAFGAVQGLAAVAGPLLGGALVDADLAGLGWRSVFWVNVPVAVVALVLGLRVLPESRASGGARLDVVGAGLSALGIVAVLLPLVQGREWGWPAWGWAVMGAGALTLVAFVRLERHIAAAGGEPVLDPALLSVRSFVAGLGASVLFFGALASFFLVLSVYLQVGTGRSAWSTGLLLLPYALGSILTSGLGVALAARAGRALAVCGSLVLAVSQAWLWLLVRGDGAPGSWSLAAALLVGGLGLGLGAPVLVNVILAGVPGRHAGAAGGVLSTVNQVGGAVGVAALGAVFFDHVASRPGADPADLYGGALAAVMPWQVGVYLLAALAMLALPPRAAATDGTDPGGAA